MERFNPGGGVRIFSTSPQSKDVPRGRYLHEVAEVARWSEDAGCEGILVYTDNSIVDPWLVSQVILQSTARLCPLVATQPAYMHPYAVAKMVASLGHLHQRRLWLNMVAGGFKNDLAALDDQTPHDRRYQRLVEYTLIVKRLLESDAPVSFEGEFYKVRNLRMTPPLDAALAPGILVSGSSPAGLEAARAIGAGFVLDHDRLSDGLGNRLRQHACDRVGRRPRRERNHDANRLRRELRFRGPGNDEQR